MCGFVGIVTRSDGARVDRTALEHALDTLEHRGPDMRRLVIGPGYGLGHVRLATLDLNARAAQPMWDATGRYALVYNGHVFNHWPLRQELSAHGHMFRTASDSEVVLHVLMEWGPAGLTRLSGQFALGWYDRLERRLLLARDNLAIKPLLYWQGSGVLLFASQPTAISSHPLFQRRLNVRAISSFLSYRQVLGGETYYEALHELAPGSWLEFHDGRLTQRRYWSLATIDAPRVDAGELRRRIRSAVTDQVAADVPVALLLSGGLDSSILAAEASRVYPSLVTYTAAMPHNSRDDESAVAARVAAAFDLKHVCVPVGPEHHLEYIEALVRQKGAPLGMHNEIELHVLARAVAQQAKVVLCGEGADELFAGYGRIFRLPFEMATRRGVTGARSPFDLLFERYTYFPQRDKQALFDPAVWRELADDEVLRETLRRAFFELPNATFFDRIWWVFVHVHLRGLLSMVDAMTMAAGVEARVPYLDPQVVAAARGLPARDKLRWRRPWSVPLAWGQPAAKYSERLDTTKFLLRRAYAGAVPDEVLERRKQGFPVPLSDWYGGSGISRTRSIVLARGARILDLMRRPALEAFVKQAADRADEPSGRQLFQLVNLELFLRNHA
jgi:asparagine synthase (glutamine-hydrolysing)